MEKDREIVRLRQDWGKLTLSEQGARVVRILRTGKRSYRQLAVALQQDGGHGCSPALIENCILVHRFLSRRDKENLKVGKLTRREALARARSRRKLIQKVEQRKTITIRQAIHQMEATIQEWLEANTPEGDREKFFEELEHKSQRPYIIEEFEAAVPLPQEVEVVTTKERKRQIIAECRPRTRADDGPLALEIRWFAKWSQRLMPSEKVLVEVIEKAKKAVSERERQGIFDRGAAAYSAASETKATNKKRRKRKAV
jgi:hypothetical protein